MPYNEKQANRLRKLLASHRGISEKKMFGGIAFMHHGNMCAGITGDKLVVRVGADQYQSCLKRKHAAPMDFTGKPLTGFVYVLPEGIKRSDQLNHWLKTGLRFTKTLPKK